MTVYSRREFGQVALAAVAIPWLSPDSRIGGVRVGAITYSFRSMPADAIIPAYVKIGRASGTSPANIEFEYEGDPVTAVGKCFELCKQMLA